MISLIIPVHNEQKNVNQLYQKARSGLKKVCPPTKTEIIFIDDGSTDNTLKELKKLPQITIIKHKKQLGQTNALFSGFKKAKGEIIITMDGDLQNNPGEIPLLVNKLQEGYDMVVGWRKKRKDPFEKIISSRLAYLWRKIIFKSPIRDSGCGFKAIRKKAFTKPLPPGEIHRFLPEIFLLKKLKVAEIPITHYQRKTGKTKYSSKRIVKGFIDSLKIRFWNYKTVSKQ